MKMTQWIMMCLLAGALALVGCGKSEPPAPVQKGVAIDLPKLSEAFANATPETQTLVSAVASGVRYGEYASALAALDKLAKIPDLNEAQKKIVSEVTEQVKQVASKASAAPPR
jgi:ribosomal protein L10